LRGVRGCATNPATGGFQVMARRPRVAIVGGGIGGLAAGLALRRRGIEVTIHEKSARISEIGAGITMSPNALKALRALGLEDAAVAIGYQADDSVIRSWRSGRVIMRQKRSGSVVERFGASFLTIHRADLLDIIAAAVPERCIRLGAECVAVAAEDGVARARFADGGEIEADIVVGADGIHSVVRESLFGPDAPHFTGCVCWRGLVPIDALPAGSRATEMTSWWGPHGHVVHYRVRRGELVNFVAHIDSDAWTEESWTHECDRAELITTYARWNESLLRLFESSERYYKWALYDRDPLEAWGKGRATLLGDAAHPMLPYLGQGACMAIEDGCILADLVARTPEDPAGAHAAHAAGPARLAPPRQGEPSRLARRAIEARPQVRLAPLVRVGQDPVPGGMALRLRRGDGGSRVDGPHPSRRSLRSLLRMRIPFCSSP
jgi:salicylate hydroxylase